MPNDKGELSPEEKQIVADWIASKNLRQCPLCGNTQFVMSETLSAITTMAGDKSIVLGGRTFPAVAIVCSNCGNSHFLNAIVMGLLPREGRSAND